MKTFLRSRVIELSNRMGGAYLWNRLVGGNIKILIYHGVNDGGAAKGVKNYYGFNLSKTLFEKHIRILRKNCNIIRFDDLVTGKNLSDKKTNVLLTFDDGYENNYLHAFEILKEFDLSAVYALPTAFINEQKPLWNDCIEFIVDNTSKRQGQLPDGSIVEFVQENRYGFFRKVMRHCVQCHPLERENIIQKLSEDLEVDFSAKEIFKEPDCRPLNANQLKEMLNAGLAEFASHSVHHYLMGKLSKKVNKTEIEASKTVIENLLGVSCRIFVLPGGSCNQTLPDQVFSGGYDYIMTSAKRNVHSGNKILHRYGVMNCHYADNFKDYICGPVHGLLHLKNELLANPWRKNGDYNE